jgi:hypothetical protein
MEDALKNSSNLKTEPLIYKYELANCYAMKMDWPKAIEQFQPLLAHEKFQVRIISGLQLATAYVMIGDQKKALETFTQVVNMNNKKSSIDQMAQRQAKVSNNPAKTNCISVTWQAEVISLRLSCCT